MRSWLHHRWHSLSTRRRHVLLGVAVVIGVLIAVRIALPIVAKTMINDRLAAIEPYRGHVGDVDLALWRGAYELSDISLSLRNPGQSHHEQLLTIESIDIGLSWQALFQGELVGTIIVTHPEFFMTSELGQKEGESPPEASQSAETAPERWQDQLRHLSVLRFDRIVIKNGVLHYRDEANDVAQIQLATVQFEVEGLALGSQAADQKATFTGSGHTIGSGMFTVEGWIDPLAEQPTFALQAALEELSGPELNPLTQRFDNLRFAAGTFSCYVELTAGEGRIEGFLKPIFVDLEVASYKDKSGSIASQLFWGALIPVAEFLLENDEENQHAARVPIEGEIEDPETDVWDVITSTLRNAFIQAIIPGFGSKS